MNREELIIYIKSNDTYYNYDKVNFKYYSDEELKLFMKDFKSKNRTKKVKKWKIENQKNSGVSRMKKFFKIKIDKEYYKWIILSILLFTVFLFLVIETFF